MPKHPKRHVAHPVPIQLPLFADVIRVRPEYDQALFAASVQSDGSAGVTCWDGSTSWETQFTAAQH
jgi:hypothetical protein